MRRHFRRFRAPTKRRKWEWIYYTNNFGSTAALAKDMFIPFRTKMNLTANLPDMTVARIRGHVSFSYPSATNLSQDNTVQCGILVFPSTTAQANIPRPFTDPWNDWMFWKGVSPFQYGPLTMAGALANPLFFDTEVDVKAMRKFHNIDDTLWFVMEEIDATLVNVSVNLAIGVKLP